MVPLLLLSFFLLFSYRKVAGDQCVPGDELSYFPIRRPCIADPPELLSLMPNINHTFPNTIITFTLQLQVRGGASHVMIT